MTLDNFANLLTAFAAVGALVFSILNSIKIETVHKATNSMKDELVAVTKLASHAEGMKDQKEIDHLKTSSHLSEKL
jgi:hypothetical protein